MYVKMLTDATGAENGIAVKSYSKGEEYEISESLAKVFIREGYAELITEENSDSAGPSDDKNAGAAPKRKRKSED